jgi:hypothetical protein
MLSATTYAVNATTAMPNPGKRLRNIRRLEKTGCLRQASRLAQGSRKNGRFDMKTRMSWRSMNSEQMTVNTLTFKFALSSLVRYEADYVIGKGFSARDLI